MLYNSFLTMKHSLSEKVLPKRVREILASEIDPAFSLRARFIAHELFTKKPKSVLDAGCGRGFYVNLASYAPFIKKIDGIDINEKYLERARILEKRDKRVTIHQGSIYKLPFKDKSFDFIVASEILEHLSDDRKALVELYRVLKKDGILVITVPNTNFPFLWDPLNWILMRVFNMHINKNMWWLAGIWADHERLYSEREINTLLSSTFHVLSSQLIVHWCFPFSHFLLYGIGKNVVENFGGTSFDRFDFEKEKPVSKLLARIFSLPSTILDTRFPRKSTMNIVISARKD